VIIAVVQLDKVDNVAVADAIVKVAERSAQDEAQRQLKHSVSSRASHAVDDDEHRSERREQGQYDGFGWRADGREDSERYSGISYIRNVKETVYHRGGFIEDVPGLNERFSPTVN
jgi:hypothetical protein